MFVDYIPYLFGGMLVLLSVLVVSADNLLHAAIALIASFFVTAALYIHFQMEFTALAQIMIYTGGIVIMMVIIILLTAQLGEKNLFTKTLGQRIWGLTVGGLLLGVIGISSQSIAPFEAAPSLTKTAGSMEAIGLRLLSVKADGFIVPFELISLLLLAALLGAVVIARRDVDEDSKGENILTNEEMK